MHSRVILSGIYNRIFTRIDSLFRAGACALCFLNFWLTYTNGCRANVIFWPLCGCGASRRTAIQWVYSVADLFHRANSDTPVPRIDTKLSQIQDDTESYWDFWESWIHYIYSVHSEYVCLKNGTFWLVIAIIVISPFPQIILTILARFDNLLGLQRHVKTCHFEA